MMYSHPSPPQSATSLSEDEEEDLDKSFYVVPSSPANWSTKPPLPLPLLTAKTLPQSQGDSTALVPHSPASRLPPEVLIHVFRQLHSPRDLHSCLLVSRSWCACSVELLWHKPHFPKSSSLFQMISVLCRKEQDQTFTYPRFIRRLNFLSLGQDLSVQLFLRLAACTRLERLTLVNCTAITDEALTTLLPCFPNLVALDLTCVSETTDRAIITLASTASRLQGLNLGACKLVTNEGVIAIAQNCPQLRRIKLSGVELLTDAAVSVLATSCPLLLEIDLNNCERITDASVRELWTHSVLMREFRLSHCHQLTDQGFPSPSSSTKATPPAGLNPFPNSVSILLPQYPPLKLKKPFEHLRMLDLTACVNITDEAIEGIVTNARKIRNLVLAKCNGLTDAAVESICKLGKNLHYLHLGHASAITDRSITKLARSCLRLRYIDLACCPLLTDMSVFELASLPKLRRIGLVRVVNLTDQAITMLGEERYDTLERIHLSYCENITIPAIHYLLQKLTKLTHLSLTGIPAFRHSELQKFCRPPPREFNSTQRAAFCVYSNSGVRDLRRYLETMMAPMHDNADGYDIEEDDQGAFSSPVGYIRDANDDYSRTGRTIADVSRRTLNERSSRLPYRHITDNIVVSPPVENTTFVQGNSNGAALNTAVTIPTPHGWESETVPPSSALSSTSRIRRSSHSNNNRTLTTSNHVSHDVSPPSSSSNHSNGQLQTMGYPPNSSSATINTVTIPVPNGTVNGHVTRRQGPATGPNQGQSRTQSPNSVRSSQSNGIAFLNSYDPVVMRREAERTAQNGTATPDLVFAELGHSRQLPIDESEQDNDWVLQERPDTPVILTSPGGQEIRGVERLINRQRLRRSGVGTQQRLSSLSPSRGSPSRQSPSQSQNQASGRLRSPSSPSFSPVNDEFADSLEHSLNGISLEEGRQMWREETSATTSVNGNTISLNSPVGNRNRGRLGGLRAALANVGLVGNGNGRNSTQQANGSAPGFTNTTATGTGAGRR